VANLQFLMVDSGLFLKDQKATYKPKL